MRTDSRLRRLLIGAVAAATVLGSFTIDVSSATASTGDRTDGSCRSSATAGADCDVYTNRCATAAAWYITVADEVSTEYYQLVNLGPKCDVRYRRRMLSGSSSVYTPWATASNTSSDRSTRSFGGYLAKSWCWSEWDVKRSDGSYYPVFYYSKNYLSSTSMQEKCEAP